MIPLRCIQLALPLLVFGSIAWAEPPPAFLHAWGTEGTRLGEFQNPTGIAFDTEGHVVVSDSHNGRIQMFSATGAPVELLRLAGTSAPAMHHPQSVGACGSGRIYVTDSEGNCIWVFAQGGLLLGDWGAGGCTAGRFSSPGGVSVDQEGNLLIADWGNRRIQKLRPDGTYVGEWPAGTGARFGVTCDAFGHMYIADTEGDQILKLDFNGVLLETWGSRGREPGQFMRPHDVAVDSKGNVYVADTYNYRIQKFSPHGKLLSMWGSFGHGDGQFVKPVSISVDASGLIAVADENANRVQVFGTPPQGTVYMDILPGACPNVVEYGASGRMQIALLGSESFDALSVDPASVRIASAAPALFGIGDLSRPPADLADPCACSTGGPDGLDDLVLTFDIDAVHAALGGGAADAAIVLALTGAMVDGRPFKARGCVAFEEFAPLTRTVSRDRIAVRLMPQPGGTRIAFTLPAEASTKLTVHDVTGRLVSRLVNDRMAGGEHVVDWRAATLRSGVYFIRLEGGDQVVVKRFSLTR